LPDIHLRTVVAKAGPGAHITKAVEEVWLWCFNPDHYYGPHFLEDVMNATLYSDAEVIGKQTYYAFTPRNSNPTLSETCHEFKFHADVRPGTLVARTGVLSADQWNAVAAGKPVVLSNRCVLAIDRFNYVENGSALERRQTSG